MMANATTSEGVIASHKCLASSVKLLTTFIEAPRLYSNICLLRIKGALDCVNSELQSLQGNFGAKVKFASSHPTLLRYGIRFLTRCDTVEKYKEVILYFFLHQCRCDFERTETWSMHRLCQRVAFNLNGSKEIHEPIIQHTELPCPEEILCDLADLLANLINLSLSKTPPNQFHKEKIRPHMKFVQKWPQSSQDLLPYGIGHSIRALTLWVTKLPLSKRRFVWVIAVPLAIVCDEFSVELYQLIGDNFKYDLAFHLPIQHINDLLNEFAEDLNPAESASNSEEQSTSWRLSYFCEGINQAWAAIYLAKRNIDVAKQCRFLTLNDKAIRPVLLRLGCVLSKPNDNITSSLKHIQRGLDELELCGPRATMIHPLTGDVRIADRSLWDKIGETYDYNALGDAWSALVTAKSSGCFYPGCLKPDLETKNAMVCAKCKFVRYCSPDCQRNAWRCSKRPHKVLCPKIVALREVFGPSVWKKIFQHEINTVEEVESVCRSKNGSQRLLQGIGAELSDLRFEKRKRQDGTRMLIL